jgi:hypothetical protein
LEKGRADTAGGSGEDQRSKAWEVSFCGTSPGIIGWSCKTKTENGTEGQSEVKDLLLQILQAVLALAIPGVLGLLYQQLGVQKNSAAALAINNAVSRVAGRIYQRLTESAKPPPLEDLLSNAIDEVRDRLPGPLARVPVSHKDIRKMIEGEFGKLLAADPNVTVAPRL